MTLQNILHVEIINPIPDTCKIVWKNIKKLQSGTKHIQNIFDMIFRTFQPMQNMYKIILDKTSNLLTNTKYICMQNISLQISEICQTLLNTSKKNSHNIAYL